MDVGEEPFPNTFSNLFIVTVSYTDGHILHIVAIVHFTHAMSCCYCNVHHVTHTKERRKVADIVDHTQVGTATASVKDLVTAAQENSTNPTATSPQAKQQN